MNYRTIFLINALVAVLFGLAFLIVPTLALKQFGVDQYAATRLVSQFFGTAILTLGLLLWFAKDITDVNLLKGTGMALMIGSAAGLIITLIGTTTGVLRTNWWIAALVYTLFGLVYAYMVFLQPRPQA